MTRWKNPAGAICLAVALSLSTPARPAAAGGGSAGDCGPGTVKVCGTVTVTNTSGSTANDFHFYMYQNDRPSVQVLGATASSAGCDSVSTSLGTDDGTPSPPPGNHGASVDASSCTPIPPGGKVTMDICLCMNERNCIKFKDLYFTSDGVPIEPGGGNGGGPPPRGGWRILRPHKGGGGGSQVPGGSGGKGAQEGNGGSGNWIHIECVENDDTRWQVLEELKLLASMTDYANPDTDIDWANIEPVEDLAGRPPVCIPPGGRWCFPFETTGAYLGGHVYQQYTIRPEFTGECSGGAVTLSASLMDDATDNSMEVVGDHPPETPLTEVLDIADYLDYQTSNDYYRTTTTTVIFGGDAIPAIPEDFFGPGSEPFTGTVLLQGVPVDPATSDADTIVRRHGEAYLPLDGSVDTIPIELHSLSLMSVNPITVTFQGSQPAWFDVIVPSSQTNGLQPTKTNLSNDGGASIHGIQEASPVNPNPPAMVLSMLASDTGGGPGSYGMQAVLDVFFQPSPTVPALPPTSGARARFKITPPSGTGLLPMEPPTVQFTPSSFDVFYAVSLDGVSTNSYHLQGSISPGQPLRFQSVQVQPVGTLSEAGSSFFDVFFVLQAIGPIVPSSPLFRMTQTGSSQTVSSRLFDVAMTLDPGFPALGSMTVQRNSPDGGTFTSTLQVRPLITFSPAGGGPPTPPLPDVQPYPLLQMAPHDWLYAPPTFPIANSGPNFFPTAGSLLTWNAPDGSAHTVEPAFPGGAYGHPVYFTCSAASPGTARIELLPGGDVFSLPVPASMSAEQKRDQLLATLAQQQPQYYPAVAGPDTFSLNGFQPGTSVRFSPGNTAEVQDKLTTSGVRDAEVAFANTFDPLDGHGQPALFTAGIVTDVGELTAQISAQELNFQTDGPIICQALFQRLAPRAPAYGSQINYAGDRLEIYFDPAYTVTNGGVIFGTNSATDGCSGRIVLPCHPADFDCDGDVDETDLVLFTACFSGANVPVAPHCRGKDLDNDGDADLDDFGVVQRCYRGPNVPADPNCAN